MDNKFHQTILGKVTIIIVTLGYIIICLSVYFRLVVHPVNQSDQEYELRKEEIGVERTKAEAMLMEARPDLPSLGE